MATRRNDQARERERGALLVEMLVAFALVSVTLVVVASTFITTGEANRATQRQVELTDSLAFALADMTREARVSTDFDDGNAGGIGTDFMMVRIFDINAQGDDPVRYAIGSGALAGRLVKEVNGDGLPLTPPQITVTEFFVDVDDSSGLLTRLYIEAQHVDAEAQDAPVRIQTSVSSGRVGT